MDYWFLLILFVIAALYASVGHGGASGYLALMAIFGFEQYVMKSSALSLNLFVSAVAFISFYRKGHFKFKVLFPFILGSMPMAFLGAKTNVDAHTYKVILSIFLLLAVTRLFYSPKGAYDTSKTPAFYVAVLIGGLVGFFSGMIGIGGGIILSPLLLLLHWSNVKETAGIAALFIFLNSIAGLIGLYFNQNFEPSSHVLIWALVGFLGGLLGAYISSTKLPQEKLKYLLAVVLLTAGLKLLII